MACFLLPKKLSDKLDGLTCNFWWIGNAEDKGICWISWEGMGKAKEEEGMGFRNHPAFNETMLTRNVWRMLMNPDAYWVRIIKGIYFLPSSYENILATKDNLFKRKFAKDNVCQICNEAENIDHLLFPCPWANLVWFGCNIKLFGDLGGNTTVAKCAADIVEKLGVGLAVDFMGKVATIAWNIWKGRNDYVFNRTVVKPPQNHCLHCPSGNGQL